jgi:hypothetical protein
MSELINKLNFPKSANKFLNIDEHKLKSLEARITGPSSTGNLPTQCEKLIEMDLELLKSSNIINIYIKGFSNKSEVNTVINELSQKELLLKEEKDHSHNNIIITNNNEEGESNKSIFTSSGKKKNIARKAEKKTKIVGNVQIDFLSTKRNRNENSQGINKDNLLNINENSNQSNNNDTVNNIEFSSKNLKSATNFFTKTKENAKMMKDFLSKHNNNNNSNNNNFSSMNGNNSNNNSQNRQINNNKSSISDSKINEFFPKISNINNNQNNRNNNNNNNSSSLNNLDEKYMKDLNNKISKLNDENEKLLKELQEKNKFTLDLSKELDKCKSIIKDKEEMVKDLNIINKQNENQINMGKMSLVKILRELEELKRTQKKTWLNEHGLKLGRYGVQRAGSKIIEIWEEGEDFIKIKQRIKEINQQKEELDKQKKKLTYIKRKDKNENSSSSNLNGNGIMEINSNDNFEHELNEQKDLICFKLNFLIKEEMELKVKMDKLEIEKILYQLEFNRKMEEDKCRYGSYNSTEKWPVLANRYLVLSLLGKGGYSEVYKVNLNYNINIFLFRRMISITI